MAMKTASVLAFERKINTSDALMYAGNWSERNNNNDWPAIDVVEKSVRGTISNRLKSALISDPAKVDAEVQKANLQTVDAAALPADCDTLMLRFSVRILGGLGVPTTCNNREYQQAVENVVRGYLDAEQCAELAYRYACNIANGRFLWRNRMGAEALEVRVSAQGETQEVMIFDAYERAMDDFSPNDTEREKLAKVIQFGLMGQGYALLSVSAFVKLGAGQEVYPSQELQQDKSVKSKWLYQLNHVAAMHAQKIGNALRTIDTWHPEAATVGAIAVEPYGSVTNRGAAYRQPKEKQDFFTLFDNWVLKGKAPELEQQHYVIAILIRGGVFGGSK